MGIPHTNVLLFILIAVLSGQITSSGQQNIIAGRITGASSKEPIKFAHIENYSGHRTTVTDTNGLFRLPVNRGDTLVISAIGYYYRMVVVQDSFLEQDIITVFELRERIYEIAEAIIYVPGTYREFKQDFVDLDIPETRNDILKQDLKSIAAIEGKKAYDEAVAKGELKPQGSGFTIRSADEKARLRLNRYLSQEKRQSLIYEKYNVDVVKKVTGLTDDDEALTFMLFCDFNEQYLLEVNPVDLMQRIAEKYAEYKKQKETG